jgi:hypothetical protein
MNLTGLHASHYNSFVPNPTVTAETVAELAICSRARWKIENETFDVLSGYHLEQPWIIFRFGKKPAILCRAPPDHTKVKVWPKFRT